MDGVEEKTWGLELVYTTWMICGVWSWSTLCGWFVGFVDDLWGSWMICGVWSWSTLRGWFVGFGAGLHYVDDLWGSWMICGVRSWSTLRGWLQLYTGTRLQSLINNYYEHNQVGDKRTWGREQNLHTPCSINHAPPHLGLLSHTRRCWLRQTKTQWRRTPRSPETNESLLLTTTRYAIYTISDTAM